MKVGIVGSPHVGPEPDEFSSGRGMWSGIPDHSICSATQALENNFKAHGLDARIVNPRKDSFQDLDALFICEFNFFDKVAASNRWKFTKPTVLWLHSHYPGNVFDGYDLNRMCSGICFTRSEALSRFRLQWGAGNYWHAPWAFPEWWSTPPVRPNPYNPDAFNLVFAGRASPKGRIPALIKSVSTSFPQVEVHVFSDVGKHVSKDATHAKVVSDFYRTPNVFFHGSWNHGTFLNYLYYADLALDSGGVPTKIANNCKIWDYLAMGTPVIVDNVAGGVELIEQTGCGIVVPPSGFYPDAIWDGLTQKFPREETRQFMRANHTWETTVSRWVSDLKRALQ